MEDFEKFVRRERAQSLLDHEAKPIDSNISRYRSRLGSLGHSFIDESEMLNSISKERKSSSAGAPKIKPIVTKEPESPRKRSSSLENQTIELSESNIAIRSPEEMERERILLENQTIDTNSGIVIRSYKPMKHKRSVRMEREESPTIAIKPDRRDRRDSTDSLGLNTNYTWQWQPEEQRSPHSTAPQLVQSVPITERDTTHRVYVVGDGSEVKVKNKIKKKRKNKG
ncbi:MAG TPA: hypothetical protein DD412_00195 [Holosporales bacterium]|nr:hypothetical protein [Holosporales bacterium]